MPRLSILLLIFICSPLSLAAADSDITMDSFEETAGRGLVIRTNPQNVTVFIDGVERGHTPVTFDNLTPGEYHVRLSKEGYRERVFTFTVFSSSRFIALIKMEETQGEALVSIHRERESSAALPFEPELFLRTFSGASLPLSPENKTLLTLPAGYHTLRARAFGWEDESITVMIRENAVVEADIYMRRAAFRIENLTQSRRRLNPANPGSLGVNEYRFEVSAFGSAVFKILDSEGSVVFSKQFENLNTRIQFVTWDGRDSDGSPHPQGIYTVLIEAENQSENIAALKLETEINYSGNIFPQTIESGSAGLAFSPMPHVLPAGSFQFDAGLLFGSFGLPFRIGMRGSPFKQVELTAVLNINPDLNNKTGWGISGSVKYNFINADNIPLLFSAGVSYSWADSNGEYFLSPGRGVVFFTPVSIEHSNFSVVFCPSAFWHGPEGFVPELLLSAGFLYRGSWINTGISARYEFNFKENADARLLAGAEVHIFPSPSNLVFSLQGGIIYASKLDYYGGIGIGLIY